MLIQKESIEKIRENFGLNHYEIKLWTALLSRGVASASELADISGVPRSRCYDVLESLEKKGFVIIKIGKPIEYIAVKPEEIVERIKKNVNKDSELNLRIIETIRESDIFKELELLHKTGIEHISAEEITDTFYGRREINKQIKELAENSESRIIISTTKNGYERKLKLLKRILSRKLKDGVKARFIAPVEVKHTSHENLTIKQIDNNLRYIISDNNVLLMITHENTSAEEERAILIKSEFFANTINGLFDN